MGRLLFAQGAHGAPVKKIQKGLGFVGDAIDGAFGARTTAAVGAFQKTHILPETGVVDMDTWGAITQLPIPTLEERALALTATFEGHGYSLAQGNFDGAGITWGIIGFTLAGGELSRILLEIQSRNPALINQAFGAKATQLLQVMRASKAKQMAFANSVSLGASNARL